MQEQTPITEESLKKVFYKSRTIALNVISITPLVLTLFTSDPELAGILSPKVLAGIYLLVGVVNIWLRFKGGQPLSVKKPIEPKVKTPT